MEYYRDITIDHTKVADTLSNFPVYIEATLGSNVANANGYDVNFKDATGTTSLDFELVEWDNTGKVWKGFVRVPSLSDSADTVIRAYYGDAGITTNQSSTSTWDSDYLAVYHLQEDPSGTNNDSTSNEYHLDANNNLVAGDSVDGKVGKGVRVGQSGGDYLRASTPIAVPSASDFTFQMWVNVNSYTGANPGIWRAGSASGDNNFNIFQSTSGRPWIRWGGGTNNVLQPSSGYSLPTSTWALIAFRVVSGSVADFVVNGVTQHTNSHSITTSAMSIYNFGWQSSTNERVDGVYDEIKVSKIVRSNEWLLTEYENQNNVGAFLSVGSEQGGGGGETVSTYYFDGHLSATNQWTDWVLADSVEWNNGFSNPNDALVQDNVGAIISISSNDYLDPMFPWAWGLRDSFNFPSSSYSSSTAEAEFLDPAILEEQENVMFGVEITDSDTFEIKGSLELQVTPSKAFEGLPPNTTFDQIEVRVRHRFSSEGVYEVDVIEARFRYSFNGMDNFNGAWTNDSNAFDDDENTYAVNTYADESGNLYGLGTTAPSSGNTITQVRARAKTQGGTDMGTSRIESAIYNLSKSELLGTIVGTTDGSLTWTDYVTLSVPTGGWTWEILSSLLSASYTDQSTDPTQRRLGMIEIEVTHGSPPSTINTGVLRRRLL